MKKCSAGCNGLSISNRRGRVWWGRGRRRQLGRHSNTGRTCRGKYTINFN